MWMARDGMRVQVFTFKEEGFLPLRWICNFLAQRPGSSTFRHEIACSSCSCFLVTLARGQSVELFVINLVRGKLLPSIQQLSMKEHK